jgi:secondary thiamine-phosphate synthase enzyme
VIEVESRRRIEAQDITDLVRSRELRDGFLWLHCPHTTCALLLNEADGALLRDLERTAAKLLEPLEPFSHARKGNPNAAAHLLSGLLGSQLLLRVRGGEPELGTYQRILFLELDGPRQRHVWLNQLPADTSAADTQLGGAERGAAERKGKSH